MSKYDGPSPFLCNVIGGHWWSLEVEQVPFAPAIARCYSAILSKEHDSSQKLDSETVAVAITEPDFKCYIKQR